MSLKILPIRKTSEFSSIGNSGQKFFLKNLIVISKPSPSFYGASLKTNIQNNSPSQSDLKSDQQNLSAKTNIKDEVLVATDMAKKTSAISSKKNPSKKFNDKQIFCRAGFTVSKNISKLANVRNLVKRRLKEALKANIVYLNNYQDYIFIARKDIVQSQYQELVKDMAFALQQIKKNNKNYVNTSKPRK
ncbi:MAG: Ribonuclease [Pseudomonadota bacterium]|jgi:ribonuclease P protein component